MRTLSPKQRRILNFITGFIRQKGYAPSLREVTSGCGISSTSVTSYNLNILQREGHLHRSRNVSRSIDIVHRGQNLTAVPLLGALAAGDPIPVPVADIWAASPEESLTVPIDLIRGQDVVYALKVKGSSMIDSMVDAGDIVLTQQANTAEDGELVAVWLKQEQAATLKRVYHQPGRIRLQPANRQDAAALHGPRHCGDSRKGDRGNQTESNRSAMAEGTVRIVHLCYQ